MLTDNPATLSKSGEMNYCEISFGQKITAMTEAFVACIEVVKHNGRGVVERSSIVGTKARGNEQKIARSCC